MRIVVVENENDFFYPIVSIVNVRTYNDGINNVGEERNNSIFFLRNNSNNNNNHCSPDNSSNDLRVDQTQTIRK